MPAISSEQTEAYYRAAILGLRALEALDGRDRRFGAEADARWQRFRGKLHDGDRLQLLLRDAAAPWGVAFAASHVFRLPGVALDEPFGAAWNVPNGAQARRYLERADQAGRPSLAACARAWGVTPSAAELPNLKPTTHLLVAGGAAILAVADRFTGRPDLDWARQITVVADAPAPRQLAGLASVFVGAVKPCAVLASDAALPAGTPVVSADAEPACAARLRA